jgi:hydroxypyruvate isomerase
MNRREFSQLAAGAAFANALLPGAPAAAATTVVRFSVMLWTIEKQFSFDRCIEIVAEAGYNGVQLVGEFQKWSAEEASRIMGRMRSLKLVFDSMSGVRAGFSNPAETQLFLAQLKAQIEAAKLLECSQIILLSGKRVDSLTPQAQQQAAVDNLKRAADLATKDQIEIVIEPIDALENPTIFLQTVAQGFRIVDLVGSPNVKVLYDFYHEQRGFGNLTEKLAGNVDRIGLVHIADVPGRHEPGTGEINYGNIYRKLADLHYSRNIAMEFYPTSEPVASLKDARLEAVHALTNPT